MLTRKYNHKKITRKTQSGGGMFRHLFGRRTSHVAPAPESKSRNAVSIKPSKRLSTNRSSNTTTKGVKSHTISSFTGRNTKSSETKLSSDSGANNTLRAHLHKISAHNETITKEMISKFMNNHSNSKLSHEELGEKLKSTVDIGENMSNATPINTKLRNKFEAFKTQQNATQWLMQHIDRLTRKAMKTNNNNKRQEIYADINSLRNKYGLERLPRGILHTEKLEPVDYDSFMSKIMPDALAIQKIQSDVNKKVNQRIKSLRNGKNLKLPPINRSAKRQLYGSTLPGSTLPGSKLNNNNFYTSFATGPKKKNSAIRFTPLKI